MTDRPTTTPAWAEDAAYVAPAKSWDGFPPTLEPPSGLRSEGWEPGARVNARFLNWLFRDLSRWAAHLAMIPLVQWFLRSADTSSTPTAVRAVGVRTTTTERDAFVAVCATGGAGVAQRSATGDSWLDTGSGLTGELRAIAWMGGSVDKWLIAGDGGKIFYRSGDVDTAWTATGPGSGDDFYAVASSADGALAVACGENGRLYTSTDGTSWTSRTSGTTADLLDVAHGGGRWVAVGQASPGDENTVITSTDGTTWSTAVIGNEQLAAVVYEPVAGVFIFVDGTDVRQLDATSGEVSAVIGTLPASGLTSLATDGHGTVVALIGKRMSVSTDAGATWSALIALPRIDDVNATYLDLVWSEALGCFVAVGNGPSIAQSLRVH